MNNDDSIVQTCHWCVSFMIELSTFLNFSKTLGHFQPNIEESNFEQ